MIHFFPLWTPSSRKLHATTLDFHRVSSSHWIHFVGLNRLLSPKKPNEIKDSIYECGIETVGETWVQLKGQYYIFGLIFLIFDIEAVFLFPWAVAYDELQLYMVFEGILFILILAGGLFYAWRRGALEWV
jgi:NADH:ubiquinone oxidoreductase subunit 3 (subunit A)